MTIGNIGQSGVTNSVHQTAQRQPQASAAGSSAKKDTAEISQAAKDLAAQKAEGSPQEEATESMSEKVQEQMSGLGD